MTTIHHLSPDIKVDLNASQLVGLTVWMPDMARPETVGPEEVLAYFRMLQDVYGGVTGAVRRPQGVQAMWAAAFFLRRFGSVEYRRELIGNSANAQFIVVRDGAPGARGPAQFVKFQVTPGTDDPRLDAMNAIVMREILRRDAPSATEHILTFSDCFLGVVQKIPMADPRAVPIYYYDIDRQIVNAELLLTGGAPDAAKILSDAISAAEIQLMEAGLTVPGTTGGVAWASASAPSYGLLLEQQRAGTRLAPAIAFEAIEGTSLEDLIYRIEPKQSFSRIADHLRPMFMTMRALGKYGWVHNDLHLGNVMYDTVKHRMILIDYGRTLFDPELLSPGVRDVADRAALKLDLLLRADILKRMGTAPTDAAVVAATADRARRFMEIASANIMFDVIQPHYQIPTMFRPYLFMYDVATVTLGIIRRAWSSRATGEQIKTELGLALWDAELIRFVNADIIIPNIYSFMRLLKAKYATIPDSIKVLLPGLIWTSMALTALYDQALTDGRQLKGIKELALNAVSKDRLLLADIVALSRDGFIYAGGYQFMGPMVNDRMFALTEMVRRYIDRYFDKGYIFRTAPAASSGMPGGGFTATAPSALRFSRARRTAAASSVVATAAKRKRDRLPDPTPMVDTRRPTPTAWTRKALREYVSPLSALPTVFHLDAETGAVIEGVQQKGGRRGGRRRGGAGASPMDQCTELLRRIAPMTARTERLLDELERTRPFKL